MIFGENESDIEWEDVCSGRGIANCFAAIEFLKTGWVLFCFVLFYFILFYFILFYFVLFYFIFCFMIFGENESDIEWEDVCSGRGIANCFAAIEFLKTGWCCFVLFCFVLFCFVLFCFVLFYFILFYFILFYFILFYFILFYILFYDFW